MEDNSSLEKVYEWVGPQLMSCPVRDGVSFYYHSEKLFKILKRKKGWHIEFSVPIAQHLGVRVLSDEEAHTRKLGKTRWIYNGDSEEVARQLIEEAMESIPRRRVIDPGMSRESWTITENTCPCFKKLDKIQENASLPSDVSANIKEAYDLLQASLYKDFVKKAYPIFGDIIDYLLRLNNLNIEGELENKLTLLAENRVISLNLKEEIQSFFMRKAYERDFVDQERAYPIAIMTVTFMSKLLKLCN